jgi:uncharacterized membrane protein YcaP (DUF421 family)
MPHIWWTQSPTTVVGALLVALALYLLVVLAFRVVKRRTVAELAPFDLAAVIAIGAITGRTATGGDSVLNGLLAIVGLLLGHWLVTRLRRFRSARAVVDQPTAVLVLDGRVQPDALRRSGMTMTDLQAVLRGHGVRSLDEVTAAVFETRNGISVLRASGDAPLWQHLD